MGRPYARRGANLVFASYRPHRLDGHFQIRERDDTHESLLLPCLPTPARAPATPKKTPFNGSIQVTARRGRLYVIAAPSGAGKTSLVRAILERRPDLRFSISCTTRPRRPAEQDGRDYFFVDHAEFERRIEAGAFLEYARVFDNYYGTLKAQVERLLQEGQDVILEIDWQGARQVRAAMPECRSIFILPPSLAELERRLRGRATDADEVIARRLRDARSDMSHWIEFDYVVVNEEFARALDDLDAVIGSQGEHLRLPRPEIERLMHTLTSEDPAP